MLVKKDHKSANDKYENYKIGDDSLRSKKTFDINDAITYGAVEVTLEYYIIKNIGNDFKKVDSIYNLNKKERILKVAFQRKDDKNLFLKDYTDKSYEDALKYMEFKIKEDFTVLTSSK